jgi:hypothetical protein
VSKPKGSANVTIFVMFRKIKKHIAKIGTLARVRKDAEGGGIKGVSPFVLLY